MVKAALISVYLLTIGWMSLWKWLLIKNQHSSLTMDFLSVLKRQIGVFFVCNPADKPTENLFLLCILVQLPAKIKQK